VMFRGINKFLVINVFDLPGAFVVEERSEKLGVTLPAKQASAHGGRAAHDPTEIVIGSMFVHAPG